MDVANIEVSLRQAQGKGGARQLRAAGKIPGVLYGEGGEAQSIFLDSVGFDTLRRTGAHHRLLDVKFEDGSAPVKALVREMQVHPVSRAVVHVDLQRVSMQKRVHITVQIVLTGKPEGVKTQGGLLEHHLREVEVECLPSDIPHQVEVDVNELLVGQALHISDLSLPGVTFLGHPGTTVATVSLPAAERSHEEAAAEAAALGAGAPAEGAETEAAKDKDKDKDKAGSA